MTLSFIFRSTNWHWGFSATSPYQIEWRQFTDGVGSIRKLLFDLQIHIQGYWFELIVDYWELWIYILLTKNKIKKFQQNQSNKAFSWNIFLEN